MKPSLVLFDLDGVLLDSRSNMEKSWEAVRTEFPHITATFQDYFSRIGRPFNDILSLLNIPQDPLIQFVYNKASKDNRHLVKPFEGVHTLLVKLQSLGYMLGIVTSKDLERTGLMLDDAGIEKFFDTRLILTPSEEFRGKPAPDQLMYAMAIANVDPSNTFYIGDMLTDAQAAARSGCNFIFAPWGYAVETTRVFNSIYWMYDDINKPISQQAKFMQDIVSIVSEYYKHRK